MLFGEIRGHCGGRGTSRGGEKGNKAKAISVELLEFNLKVQLYNPVFFSRFLYFFFFFLQCKVSKHFSMV